MAQTTTRRTPARAEIGAWLARGWDWFVEDLPIQLAIGFFAAILISVGNAILAGPVLAGLALASTRKVRLGKVVLSDFFEGFRFFVWALLSFLLIAGLALIGLIFLIVPGIVILAMYSFTFHFIVDDEMDFWEAMQESRRFVSGDYLGFTLFFLLLAGLNFVGVCFFGVGSLVSLPLSSLMLAAAIHGSDATHSSQGAVELPPPPPIVIE